MRAEWGLRGRIVAITTGLLAAALILGALALAAAVLATERAGLDAQMRRTAAQVATLVDENRLPATLPVSGAQLVQVVDSRGAVVAASPAADRLTALLSPQDVSRVSGADAIEVPGNRIGEAVTLRALAIAAGPESRGRTVLVASPVADVTDSQRGLWIGLAVGVPLVLLLAAVLLWRAVGAALRPVDELRAGAENIGAEGSVGSRLPVPAADDEIRALAVTLNGMLDRLDAAAAGQRRFVADAAHELRSPLASLRMQIEVAARLDGGDLPAELLPDVDRLTRLVDDLLLLARAGSGAPTHRPDTLDLAVLVDEVVARYDDLRVPVRAQIGPESVPVHADRLGLDRALSNLLDNAVRHASSGVQVRLRRADDAAIVEVADDGFGVAPGDRERVFDRFTRLDAARDRDAGGSGLGLPIARELMAREGGEVTLHNADPGLLARMTLPAG